MSRQRYHSSESLSKRHRSHHSSYDHDRDSRYMKDRESRNKEQDREKEQRSYTKGTSEGSSQAKDDEKERMRIKQEKIQQFLRQRAARMAEKEKENTGSTEKEIKENEQKSSVPSIGACGSVSGFEFGRTVTKKSSQAITLDDDEKKRKIPMASHGDEDNSEESLQKEQKNAENEEEEVDPLDLFMQGMDEVIKRDAEEKVENHLSRDELLDNKEDSEEEEEENTINDPRDILAFAQKKMKKRELPNIDHSKIHYEPIRKNFYVEPHELSEMTEQEVNDYRLELDGIKIRGLNCPKPIQNWSQCGLPAHVLDIIYQLKYEKPTAIQAQAIPAIMTGRDIIGVAKTGSGKTISFLLPMFRHIKDQRPIDSLEGPIALIMTPTRELAVQIHKECKHFLKVLGLRAVCAYGGSPIKDQIAELKRGAEIVVCTPGRIIDLLGANQGRVTNLKRTSYIVLDEADRMFDLGFEPQVMKVINNVRPDRQTVLFSATFPKQMDILSRKILQKPIEITVGARSVVASEIQQLVEVCTEDNKFVRLLELLGNLYVNDDDVRTLVFVDRQEAADSLLRDLMRRGYPCMSIHGGKDQFDRDSTIADFRAGVFPILIATSVAARGLDIKQLKLVVNYDCPNHLEDYVHRVGRTGRAGETGTAVTFITPEQDRYAADIVRALRISKANIPEDVQNLANEFIKKVKSGQEKASGSGFGGKGLDRLDKDRDLARKLQRRAYGEESDEEIDVFDDDYEYSKMDLYDMAEPDVPFKTDSNADSNSSSAASQTNKKGNITDDILERVRKAAGSVTSRLQGQSRSGITIESGGPDSREFTATIEINDFPQKARWAVTNRTNIARIIDLTGTSITNKGNWYPPGKPVPPGETKLYILIEGETQISVDRALYELKRLLTEGTVSALESEIRSGISGRYSVL
ncbi:hypothetical protein T552_02501 [Pneumocystis carinii B80]|uniref:RNA helicase n=1 Tax=Pneumocystis carinii (strain B80) TaxID=1408658 RepID=A0A0W4ZF44_PNEC8|nr:hypothetical protein T552_02501 [Pneumocystis carinii B80]KTW27009.1 hypothetical protein T552_02501 [Pneumocystis carinii B80]